MSIRQLVCKDCGTVENECQSFEPLVEPRCPCECGCKRFVEEVVFI